MKTVPSPDSRAGPRAFVAEHADHTAFWAALAREAATINDDVLLAYATRKAAAYARAFVGAVRDMIALEQGGGA